MCRGTSTSIWEVVGGASNGGILVRTGKDIASDEASERLGTGSLVQEMENDDGRICYTLLSGTGPTSGWVSTTYHGKDLLVKTSMMPEETPLIVNVPQIDEEAEEDEQLVVEDGTEMDEYLVDPLVIYSLRMAAAEEEFEQDATAEDLDEVAQEAKVENKQEQKITCAPIETAIDEGVKFKGGKFEESLPQESKTAPAPRVSHAPLLGRRFKAAGKPMTGGRPKIVSAIEEVKPVSPVAEKPENYKQTTQKQEPSKQTSQHTTDAKAAPAVPRGNEPVFFSGPSQGPAKTAAPQKDLHRVHDLDSGKLCRYCSLPVGDSCYFHESARAWVHGECYAQLLLEDYMEEDEKRLQKEAALKRARRDEYEIGWKVDHIPRNVEPALQLGCALVPQGLCCLVLQDDFKSACVAPTIEPAAAMNLEYLSTALKVRRKDGREPLFSLDPIDIFDHKAADKNAMQTKRFEPEWLAGTRAGEVLFQSDYHLKELSMGEYNQPIVGMKSCLEYSRKGMDDEWFAREWFLVRDAKIQMSDDNVVVPYVRMGVEAREQLPKGNVMVDAPITRKDHPMVKYAETFTRNFDLIAERKSVVYNLRELAKASVVAKFLIDNEIQLEDTWFNLAEESQACCSLEIPQLWNERLFSQIQMKDGEINFEEMSPSLSGVYGGVEFGLERFTLTTEEKPKVAAKLGGTMKKSSGMPAVGMKMVTQAGAPPPKVSLRAPTAVGAPAAVSVAASMMPASVQQALSAAAVSAPRRVAPTRVRAAGPTQLRKMAPLDKTVPPARMALPLGLSSATVSTVSTTSTVPPVGQRGVTPLIATGTVSTASTTPGYTLSGTPLVGRVGPSGALSALGAPRAGAYSTVAPKAPAIELSGEAPGLSAVSGVAASFAAPAATIGAFTGEANRSLLPASARYRMTSQGLSADPQGVDLNLDQFNLTTAERLEDEGDFLAQETSFSISASFFSGMGIEKGSTSCFKDKDAELLRAVFNPNLCDRRDEGECFVPPDTRASYLKKLRKMVQHEEDVRAKRTELFLSPSFVIGDAGLLFPPSWTSRVEIAGRKSEKGSSAAPGSLHPRSDYGDRAQQIMKSAKAIFDKTTEDGVRFRIYRVGSVEVRTTQLHEEEEVVGAVFSIRDAKNMTGDQCRITQASERIEKVTEYVERPVAGGEHGFYVVFETEKGNVIVSQKMGATTTWEENVVDLADRNSLAKVVRTGDCQNSNTTVADVKKERVQLISSLQQVSDHGGRLYAQDLFIAAMGGISKVEDAYLQKEFDATTVPKMRPSSSFKNEAEDLQEQKIIRCQSCGKNKEAYLGYKGTAGSGMEDAWCCTVCWKSFEQK